MLDGKYCLCEKSERNFVLDILRGRQGKICNTFSNLTENDE